MAHGRPDVAKCFIQPPCETVLWLFHETIFSIRSPPKPRNHRLQLDCAVLTVTPPSKLPSHSLRTVLHGPTALLVYDLLCAENKFTVKVENKPDSDVDRSQPQAVTKPGPDAGSSPQLPASTAEESNSNVDMGGPDSPEESSSGKKVVKVVRRVIRRVTPASTEQPNQPAVPEAAKTASAADSVLKTTRTAREDKDDISMGLTSLMGRSRTKEHRPRTRTQDRKEDVKEEVKQEDEKEKVEEKPTEDKSEEATPTPAPDLAPPKSNPLSPPAGFVPAPKPDHLAPPAGFIPVHKQNLLTPPSGFIPRKSSPVPPKQNPLTRPPGFLPVIKTDPLAPPAGFIPKPRPLVVKKPEVEETSCPPTAPNGKPSQVALPQAQSANKQVPELIPTEDDYKRVRRIFTVDDKDFKLVEDPVAILQAAHSAAAKV
ncbi:uncharacterized protein LOC143333045 [Chaetodon auriga]|uniref:uncharacterized protein LOC143333045 n=1 Tax=Chaetodon auriga TaxID=39042 RepID=UPI004032C971